MNNGVTALSRAVLLVAMTSIFWVLSARANDTYNDGADYARRVQDSSGKTITGFTPATVLPQYSDHPPQAGYYGGDTASETNLDAPGSQALANSDAGKAITNSVLNNPKTPVSGDAPFIQAGTDAEAKADSVTRGPDNCQVQQVSRTQTTTYHCERDINATRTCARDATIAGQYVPVRRQRNISIANAGMTFVRDGSRVRGDFVSPVTGTVTDANFDYALRSPLHGYTQSSTIVALGSTVTVRAYGNGNYPLSASGYSLTAGATYSVFFDINQRQHHDTFVNALLNNLQGKNGTLTTFSLNITIMADEQEWRGQAVWPGPCALSQEAGATLTGSVCSAGAADRPIVVDGVTHTVHSNCWEYTDTYRLQDADAGTCGQYATDTACTLATQQCAYSLDGVCLHQNVAYNCEKRITGTATVCGGEIFCSDGACEQAVRGQDDSFAQAVSQLAAVAAAGKDAAAMNAPNVRAFTGHGQSCRKTAAGFNNCCQGSGWGGDAGLAHCSSDEKALGKARERLLTVDVGEYCSKKVLGVCLEKKRSYCVFDSKLAQIVQQQGRQWQLGVGFGSPESPDCSGITVTQLQALDFKRMDFRNFYQDLTNGTAVPDAGTLQDRIRAQVAAQVQKTGNTK